EECDWFKESRSSKDNPKSDWYIWRDPKPDGSAPTNWRSIFGGSAWTYDENRGQYYLHTFLPEQPDLNWENPEVREALIDIANFWVDKGVGGFRLDAITYIKKPKEFTDGVVDEPDGLAAIHKAIAKTEGILDFLHEFKDKVQKGTDIFTVGEANGVSADNLSEWVGPKGVFDMIFEFTHVLVARLDEEDWCLVRDWKLPYLKSLFSGSQKTTLRIGGWYPVFLENHDQPRSINHFLPEGADRVEGAKALATLLLTMRGTPFIMQGEELGLVNVGWDSIEMFDDVLTKSHYELALKKNYSERTAFEGARRFSRDNTRTPMQWNSTINAGFTKGKPWLPLNDDYNSVNAEAEEKDRTSVLNFYRYLASLRKELPELTEGGYRELFPESEEIFAFERKSDENSAIVLINLSDRKAEYDTSCLEGMCCVFSTRESKKGTLFPFEAALYRK
nr:glucohydrolase [Sphaerochaetaceae bacterium]